MLKVRNLFAGLVLFLTCVTVHADVFDAVRERGTLRVGVSLFTPWAMRDKAGELVGFEIDVARRLAAEMGVVPAFKVYVWEDIIKALNASEIDVIVSGMAITPARALQLEFSRPYAESGVSLATNTALTAGIQSMQELNRPDIKVATVAETLGDDVARLVFDQATLQTFETSDAAEQAVLDGKMHVYVASTIEVDVLALEHPDKVDVPLAKPLLVSVSGMGVKRGEQGLLNFLNAWIAARSADKWLPATHKHWFKSLDWRDQVKP